MSLIIYKKTNVTVIIKDGTAYQGRVTATVDPTNETVSYQINEGGYTNRGLESNF